MMNLQGDAVKSVIATLAKSEDALSLPEFTESTKLPTREVAEILDFLVTIRILISDNSFACSEIGSMIYMFADNDEAQRVAKSFE